MNRFSRNQMVFGAPVIQRLQSASVAVFGLGGVGGAAAECLTRSGVGHLILVDFDKIHSTNQNRQILSLDTTVGIPKTEVAAQRFIQINPEIRLTIFTEMAREEFNRYLQPTVDFVVDAIDGCNPKVNLLVWCHEHGIPVISCMGAGGRRRPADVQQSDLFETRNCPLASRMRKFLRRRGINQGIPVIHSLETPAPTCNPDREEQSNHREETGRIRQTIGSTPFIPIIMGAWAAAYAVNTLIDKWQLHE